MKVWRRETCKKIQREKRETQDSEEGRTHRDNPTKKKRRRGGEGVKMAAGVEEVGDCPVDRVWVPSSGGLKRHSCAKD